MYPSRFYPNSYFAPRYWPKVGDTVVDPGLGVSASGGYVPWQTTVIVCGSLFGGLQLGYDALVAAAHKTARKPPA